MSSKIDLTGKVFGRLAVVSDAGSNKHGKVMWLCECECGTQSVVCGSDLRTGHTKSCGCLSRDVASSGNYKHGMEGIPIYKVWAGMLQRCNNPKNKRYKNYGGRGIKVCKRWDKFENFYADMDERPEGLTIERIDNDGNYEPSNCKWATRKENSRNTRTNRIIKYEGISRCLSAWAEELGINKGTLKNRLNKYPPQIAFNM